MLTSNYNENMQKQIFTICFLLAAFFMLPSFAHAEIIFQDNFDTCTSGCTVGVSSPNSANWMQWMQDPPISFTYNSVTHNSGEITMPGRNDVGKSLKLWRAGTSNVGSASYSGSLVLESPPGGARSDFHMRFYMKLPTALTPPPDTKLFRLNTSSGGGEIYVNLNGDGSGRGGTILWLYGTGGDSAVNTTLLSASQLNPLWDGNWHCWEFHFNLTAGTVTFWGDDVQLGSITDSRLEQGTWNSYLQHFPLGNAQQGNWQDSWQALEVDDFVISTEHIGPDMGADIIAPSAPSGLSVL